MSAPTSGHETDAYNLVAAGRTDKTAELILVHSLRPEACDPIAPRPTETRSRRRSRSSAGASPRTSNGWPDAGDATACAIVRDGGAARPGPGAVASLGPGDRVMRFRLDSARPVRRACEYARSEFADGPPLRSAGRRHCDGHCLLRAQERATCDRCVVCDARRAGRRGPARPAELHRAWIRCAGRSSSPSCRSGGTAARRPRSRGGPPACDFR